MAYLHYCGLLDPTVDRDFDGVSVPCIISLANEVTHFGRGSALSRVYGWPLMSDIGYEQKSVQVVSRLHAEIIRNKKRNGSYSWRIVDKDSLNGTFVNRIRIGSAVLTDGDIVHFGGGHSVEIGAYASRPATDFVYRFTVCSKNSNIPLADSPKLPLPTPLRTAGLHLSPRPQNCSSSPVRRLPTVKRTLEADSGVEMDSGPGKMARNDTVSSPLHNHSASVHVPELPSPLRHVSQDVPPVPRSQWDVALNVAEAFVAALPTQTTTTPVPASLASEILPELCCPLCAGIMIDPVVAQCSHGFCLSCIIQRLQSKDTCPVCDVRMIPNYHLDSVIEVCLGMLPSGHASVSARNSGISRHKASLSALKFAPEALVVTPGHEDDDAILECAIKRTSVFDEPEPIDSEASVEHDWESSDTESEV